MMERSDGLFGIIEERDKLSGPERKVFDNFLRVARDLRIGGESLDALQELTSDALAFHQLGYTLLLTGLQARAALKTRENLRNGRL